MTTNSDIAGHFRKLADLDDEMGDHHGGLADLHYQRSAREDAIADLIDPAPVVPPVVVPPEPPATLPPREVIMVTGSRGIEITGGGGQGGKDVLIENKEYIYVGPPIPNTIGISVIGPRAKVTVRNVVVRNFMLNLAVQGAEGRIGKLLLEDFLLVDAGKGANEKSNGLYLSNIDDIEYRRGLFLRNGAPNTLSHNAYLQGDCGPAHAYECVFAHGGSHGEMARAGGLTEDCVFYENAIGLSFGGGTNFVPGGVKAYARRLVVLRGKDISAADPRGWGLMAGNVNEGEFSDIILADSIGHSTSPLVLDPSEIDKDGTPSVGVLNLNVHGNLALRWPEVYKPSGTGPMTGTTVSWLPVTPARLAVNLYTPELDALLAETLPRPSAAAYCAAMRLLMGMPA